MHLLTQGERHGGEQVHQADQAQVPDRYGGTAPGQRTAPARLPWLLPARPRPGAVVGTRRDLDSIAHLRRLSKSAELLATRRCAPPVATACHTVGRRYQPHEKGDTHSCSGKASRTGA
ncbi:hypothetical protein SCATT_50600 [Streptantibioticus cattleyicolor NRRL 8057 = DSM 46488]|uniref:Uncharacterized protein n=1 Tax=Streptantibioticus cattleyicolor (strain ATCC 35852 / DSM 46488 / JCM 4925 / NBRC 14057 / NRRL 8057) TaxID=1003195 RepID=G8X3Q8_STREN|nr:hypothetical protein SCATT_50600 [Streptantibioticus cattleyicolor NRRL 8057 = DSM 46488]